MSERAEFHAKLVACGKMADVLVIAASSYCSYKQQKRIVMQEMW